MKAVPAAVIAATLAAGAAAYAFPGSAKANPAKLQAALALPIEQGTVTHGGAGTEAVSAQAAQTAPRMASKPALARTATAARPSASASSAATRSSAAPATAQSPAARPATTASSPSPSASSTKSASAVSCSDNSYLLPANVTAIVNFLLANGYSDNAVAGIAGNIYQESKGDPESIGMGGGGLIGWTPLPSGFVTGNPTADLQTQLSALLTYNQGWSGYIPELNAAASPADAAYIYVTDFERAGIPAASTREDSAEAVASACGI